MEDVVKVLDTDEGFVPEGPNLPLKRLKEIPDEFKAEEPTGIKVEITFDPIKNHLNVNAGIEEGDELVLMMLRKAYHTWRKRVLDNIQ